MFIKAMDVEAFIDQSPLLLIGILNDRCMHSTANAIYHYYVWYKSEYLHKNTKPQMLSSVGYNS